ncbi:hypothetical protein D3C86_469310 [compost metagenome]
MNYGLIVARSSASIGFFLCLIPALAQTPPLPAVCKPIPYAVGDALKGGEVAGRLGAGALGKLLKLPEISGVTGGEIVKTAYAGMNSQAMSDVFDVLGCRVKAFIKDSDTDAEKKRAAVTMAVAHLNGEMAFIQSAYSSGPDAVGALKAQYFNASRADGAPVLNPAITSEALRSIDTDKLFINVETRKWWGGLDFGSNVSIQACSGVVRAAISDGGSSLQQSLAATRDILTNYLDPDLPPVVALSKLMLVTVSPTFKPAPAFVSTFKDCTKDLTQAAETSAAKAATLPVVIRAPVVPASTPGGE